VAIPGWGNIGQTRNGEVLSQKSQSSNNIGPWNPIKSRHPKNGECFRMTAAEICFCFLVNKILGFIRLAAKPAAL
jgi:hypothetical protein